MGSRRLVLVLVVALAVAAPVAANPASDRLRAEAAERFYNLDRDQALDLYRQAAAADPNDAAAFRGIATTLWIAITSRRGNMTVDDYIGAVKKPPETEPPPPEILAEFEAALGRALALARARVAASPNDVDAHYQLGAAAGIKASFAATVERSAVGAFRGARDAYAEHERVLRLDPHRQDAGLIIGIYRYVIAALARPLRWLAYVAGFDGDKEMGLRFVQEAAAYPGENQADARVALVLMFNREKQFDAALQQLDVLRARYPRNRLFWLESGATSIRAGRFSDADRFLDEGMRRFSTDTRPRVYGEYALWRYKRGIARAALGRMTEARQDLAAALGFEGRAWIHGRSHLELGRLAAKAGDRASARRHFHSAMELCESDNDDATAEEARRQLAQIS